MHLLANLLYISHFLEASLAVIHSTIMELDFWRELSSLAGCYIYNTRNLLSKYRYAYYFILLLSYAREIFNFAVD